MTGRIGPLTVPTVGVGGNNFGRRLDADRAAAVVHSALDAGAAFFDTADVYGDGLSEEFLGAGLGTRRDEAVVATKFGSQMGDHPARRGASPRWIARAVEDSLRRLGTDRIDLYQLHTPDPQVPVSDTLEALDRLVQAGKVREVGCSNFSAEQIDEASRASASAGVVSFVSVQNHYSLVHREPEQGVTAACERHGLALLPYFPLAGGVLTGKYRRGQPPPDGTRLAGMPPERASRHLNDRTLAVAERLEGFARERGRSLLELAVSWLAAQPTVASVIAGATSPEQLQANIAAAGWRLSAQELAEIDRLSALPG